MTVDNGLGYWNTVKLYASPSHILSAPIGEAKLLIIKLYVAISMNILSAGNFI